MKSRLQVQYHNKNVDASTIEKFVKENHSVYYVATTKTGEVIGNKEPLFIE